MFDFDVRSGTRSEEYRELGHETMALADLSQPISSIPRRPHLVIAPTSRLGDALALMVERQAAAALVASHDVLLGMLHERHLLRRLLAAESATTDLPVWRVMTAQPETLVESDTVGYAARKLRALGATAMPILRSGGDVFGLLDSHDLMAWMCGAVGAAPHVTHRSNHT